MMIKNNNKRLKILTEFGDENNKALLIEMPPEIIEKLPVDADGTVDTVDFIKVCLDQYQQPKPMNLDQLIFDTSVAYESRK